MPIFIIGILTYKSHYSMFRILLADVLHQIDACGFAGKIQVIWDDREGAQKEKAARLRKRINGNCIGILIPYSFDLPANYISKLLQKYEVSGNIQYLGR